MATNRYSTQPIQTGSPGTAATSNSSGAGSSGYGAGTGVEPYSPLGTPNQLVDPETIYTKQNIIGTIIYPRVSKIKAGSWKLDC